ncbi:MAG: ring-cleaving dioxygenase [Pseudomonadota bacterium]
MQLGGIHHLTAVTADVSGNHAFYTRTLGMRLVKKSVNQDDVSAYHLFYADGEATPGTDLTFFDWPVPREQRGSNSIVRTGLRVGSEATLEWWAARFRQLGVPHRDISDRAGRAVIDFEDFEGQRFGLVVEQSTEPAHPWARSPVPAEHQIRGLGPITLSVPVLAPTDRVLTGVMNMRRGKSIEVQRKGEEAKNGQLGAVQVQVYDMGPGGPGAELHVVVEPGLQRSRQGAGGVHHVAFRTTAKEYAAWADRLVQLGMHSSGPVNRYYFQSLYFREPNGILFEIATDEPGFTADEPLDQLGEKLALPPFLEGQRKEIEAGLKPLA